MLQLLHKEQKKNIEDKLNNSQKNGSFKCTLPFAPYDFNASLSFYKHNPDTLHFLIEAEDSSSGKRLYISAALPFEQVIIGTIKVSFQAESDEATVILFTPTSIHAGRSGFFTTKYTMSTTNLTGKFEFVDHLRLTFKGEFSIYRAN
ncbi:hypothetical protein IMF27_02845 [Pseudomonas sp. PCH199]|uniref:hypothetical protein n=1 Tax=unclassified Pseudomonas TaxID=196821 RepID=UPI000BC7A14B|nr:MULTISPECIES: hypothetical protein [unclassified Pseudomonas]MCW8274774.1 hypothetical protein [Pseudomonas sp. PCH199]PAM85438.1 hypothetical protein CES87_02900 [Pseudomonas sp. ERMR1:02]